MRHADEPDCGTCAALRRAVETTAGEAGIAAVSYAALASATQLPEAEVREHVGELPAFVRATYGAVIEELMERCLEDLQATPSWPEGFHYAAARHVERLAADSARARLCYVEIDRDPVLREDTEDFRAQTVEMLARFQRTVTPDAPLPLVRVELLYGALTHMIERHIHAGTLDELPAQVGDALAALDPGLSAGA